MRCQECFVMQQSAGLDITSTFGTSKGIRYGRSGGMGCDSDNDSVCRRKWNIRNVVGDHIWVWRKFRRARDGDVWSDKQASFGGGRSGSYDLEELVCRTMTNALRWNSVAADRFEVCGCDVDIDYEVPVQSNGTLMVTRQQTAVVAECFGVWARKKLKENLMDNL